MFKKRVGCRFDTVEEEILLVFIQPEWQGIADKMYLMAPLGELLPQFGGHYPGTACDRVACYSYVHLRFDTQIDL